MIEQEDIEQYIRTHQLSHDDWRDICRIYKLSEELIREFRDQVEWLLISKYQRLSEQFMREFKNKLWLTEIVKYQDYSLSLLIDLIKDFECTDYQISSIKNILKTRNLYDEKFDFMLSKALNDE